MEECKNPDCGNELPEEKEHLCEECEPTEEEIKEAKQWAEQYTKRWQKATERLEKNIEECPECTEDSVCERHRARGELAFSGRTAEEVDRELSSLELRLEENEVFEQ